MTIETNDKKIKIWWFKLHLLTLVQNKRKKEDCVAALPLKVLVWYEIPKQKEN